MNLKNTSELWDAWKIGYRPLAIILLLGLLIQACITLIRAEGEVTIEHDENNGLNVETTVTTETHRNDEQDTTKQRKIP